MARGQGLQPSNLAFHPFSAFVVALVDHENVGDLHDPRFDRLHVIAHAGNKNHNGDIGQAHDVDFILAHPHRLNHNDVAARGVEHRGDIGRRPRQSAQ